MVDEVSFANQMHRRKYRVVYNRFMSWWFRSHPVWEEVAGHPCKDGEVTSREGFQNMGESSRRRCSCTNPFKAESDRFSLGEWNDFQLDTYASTAPSIFAHVSNGRRGEHSGRDVFVRNFPAMQRRKWSKLGRGHHAFYIAMSVSTTIF